MKSEDLDLAALKQRAQEELSGMFLDLWNEHMPHSSGHMYFAIPGEQPIHVDDEEALHILAYLSESRY